MPLTDLLGHQELFASLQRELGRHRSQGYLFAGPRGVGKGLVAEGLTLSLMCEREHGPNFCCTPDRCPNRGEPAGGRRARTATAVAQCGCCSACVQIALRVHPDFDYLSRQSGRAFVLIEQVRALIARLGRKPSRGPLRIAIIDDAESLNLPAQNALLKTLEEPPGYAVMFLIAENANSLLDTVRSRLRPAHFPPLSFADLTSLLIRKANLDQSRAAALARLSRGSASRALSLAAGTAPPARELLEALRRARQMDVAGMSKFAERFFSTREEAVENCELLARLMEDMLCLKLAQAETVGPPGELSGLMREMAAALSLDGILLILGLALRAAAAVEGMANARLQAEGMWIAAGEVLTREGLGRGATQREG